MIGGSLSGDSTRVISTVALLKNNRGTGLAQTRMMNGYSKPRQPISSQLAKSRTKVVSYTSRRPSAEQDAYYEHLLTVRQQIEAEGIDLEVSLSWKRERLNWATGVSLIVPFEVRNEEELGQVAALAKRLLLGQTTLQNEFLKYRYGKTDWLREQGTDQ